MSRRFASTILDNFQNLPEIQETEFLTAEPAPPPTSVPPPSTPNLSPSTPQLPGGSQAPAPSLSPSTPQVSGNAQASAPIINNNTNESVRITNAQHMLTLASDLSNDYRIMKSSQATTTEVQSSLNGELQTLQAKKKDLETGIQTFEQDFLEKRKSIPAPRQGFQTLQDTVLAIFFASYILISIVFCTYVSRSTNSLLFFGVALFILIGLAVVIAQIIIRFA